MPTIDRITVYACLLLIAYCGLLAGVLHNVR